MVDKEVSTFNCLNQVLGSVSVHPGLQIIGFFRIYLKVFCGKQWQAEDFLRKQWPSATVPVLLFSRLSQKSDFINSPYTIHVSTSPGQWSCFRTVSGRHWWQRETASMHMLSKRGCCVSTVNALNIVEIPKFTTLDRGFSFFQASINLRPKSESSSHSLKYDPLWRWANSDGPKELMALLLLNVTL